jgi:hypothetical protein
MERKGTLLNSFYKYNIALIPNKKRTQQQKELYANFFNEHICKNSQYWQTKFSHTLKRSHTIINLVSFLG